MVNRISGIDSIRGTASIYILIYHFLNNAPGLPPGVYSFFSHGILGLQLFFAMSGFLIMKSFSERTSQELNPISNYFIRRFFRIIPLWWSLLFFLVYYWHLDTQVVLVNMFFIFGFLGYNAYYLPVPSAWSLFVEEFYYFLFPFISGLLRGLSTWVFLILAYFLSMALFQYGSRLGIPTENGFLARIPLVHLQFFFIGVLVYRISANNQFMREVIRFNGKFALTWLDLLCFLGVLSAFGGLYGAHEITCFLLLLAAIIPETMLCRLTDNAFLKWIGVRCYGVYILHIPLSQHARLLSFFHTQFPEHPLALRIVSALIIDFAFIAGVAGMAYAFIERPCLRFANRWIQIREMRKASNVALPAQDKLR